MTMAALDLTQLDTNQPDFYPRLKQKLAWETISDKAVADQVERIIAAVRDRGDEALIEYTRQFDALDIADAADLLLSGERLQQALLNITAEQRSALQQAAERIREYHEQQKQSSWQYRDRAGNLLGQQITPMQRVGVYVPGGKAAYPSTVLMNVIPARVAGVDEIIMVVPATRGQLNELVLAAAAVAQVDKVYCVGGAQAIAALAYGTQSIAAVDKIVGPGNIYVATAKRQVFGQVGIDMIAGPSEVLIISDGNTDPDWLAMDLFSQAEHDENAQAILVATEQSHLDAVKSSMQRLLGEMDRAEVILQSLNRRGLLIKVQDLDQAIEVANQVAPEHLELAIEDADQHLYKVRNAGAIFVGSHTPEALGDYCAGPNHVLPTSGTARFSSPLGVYDFQKRSSIIQCNPQGASQLAEIASVLAQGEGLSAHARSAQYRIREKDGN